MKKAISFLIICIITNLTFAQNIDENGNITNSLYKVLKSESSHKSKSIKSNSPVILKTIPNPTSTTNDIAYDGVNLWQASNDLLIYKISPVDGTLLKTIPINTDYASSLTFDGTSLWVSDRTNQLLLQIDTLDGTVQQQFSWNNDRVGGLAWDNTNLWHNNNKQGSFVGDSTFYVIHNRRYS